MVTNPLTSDQSWTLWNAFSDHVGSSGRFVTLVVRGSALVVVVVVVVAVLLISVCFLAGLVVSPVVTLLIPGEMVCVVLLISGVSAVVIVVSEGVGVVSEECHHTPTPGPAAAVCHLAWVPDEAFGSA